VKVRNLHGVEAWIRRDSHLSRKALAASLTLTPASAFGSGCGSATGADQRPAASRRVSFDLIDETWRFQRPAPASSSVGPWPASVLALCDPHFSRVPPLHRPACLHKELAKPLAGLACREDLAAPRKRRSVAFHKLWFGLLLPLLSGRSSPNPRQPPVARPDPAPPPLRTLANGRGRSPKRFRPVQAARARSLRS
jgi:hypothetical protein